MASENNLVLYAALAGNLAIAATKFIAVAGIERVLAVTTVHLAPRQIMVLARTDFADELD